MPKNILKRFSMYTDLRMQVAGYVYGSSRADNDQVKEIRCIAMVPQIGCLNTVQLPHHLPQHDYLTKENVLDQLGWIHTWAQPNETPYLNTFDTTWHARLMLAHKEWDEKTIAMTVTFKAGLVSLAEYGLRSGGDEWGAQNKDLGDDMPPGFQTTMGEKCQLLLSDKLMGIFLVPESGVWNYSFLRANFSTEVEKRAYHVKIDTPVGYYADIYRPLHFQNFAELEDIRVDRIDNLE